MTVLRRRFRLSLLTAAALPVLLVVVTAVAQAKPRPGGFAPPRPAIPQPRPPMPPPAFQPPRPAFPPPTVPRPVPMPVIIPPHMPNPNPQWVWRCTRCNQVVGTGFARPNLNSCPHCGAGGNNPGVGNANPFLGNEPVQQPADLDDARAQAEVGFHAPDAGVRWGIFGGMTVGVSVLTGVVITMLKRLGD